jgi:hypothetical protein
MKLMSGAFYRRMIDSRLEKFKFEDYVKADQGQKRLELETQDKKKLE